jgi:hypothetical protein
LEVERLNVNEAVPPPAHKQYRQCHCVTIVPLLPLFDGKSCDKQDAAGNLQWAGQDHPPRDQDVSEPTNAWYLEA